MMLLITLLIAGAASQPGALVWFWNVWRAAVGARKKICGKWEFLVGRFGSDRRISY